MSTFPSVTPTSRRYSPGNYPQKTYRSLSGIAIRRTYGNAPYGASLDLEYKNISDVTVNTLLDHYHSQTAINKRFQLSTAVTAGMGTDLRDEVRSLTADRGNLRWEYAQAPQIESVHPGLSVVRITLTGEIRDPNTDDS